MCQMTGAFPMIASGGKIGGSTIHLGSQGEFYKPHPHIPWLLGHSPRPSRAEGRYPAGLKRDRRLGYLSGCCGCRGISKELELVVLDKEVVIEGI